MSVQSLASQMQVQGEEEEDTEKHDFIMKFSHRQEHNLKPKLSQRCLEKQEVSFTNEHSFIDQNYQDSNQNEITIESSDFEGPKFNRKKGQEEKNQEEISLLKVSQETDQVKEENSLLSIKNQALTQSKQIEEKIFMLEQTETTENRFESETNQIIFPLQVEVNNKDFFMEESSNDTMEEKLQTQIQESKSSTLNPSKYNAFR